MKRFLLCASIALIALVGFFAVKPRTCTLEQMVKAGQYDHVDGKLTESNFPVKARRFTSTKLEVVGLDQLMTTDEALIYLDLKGLRPAITEELLAFGADSPETQRERSLTALGSFWVDTDGHRHFPTLSGDEHSRLVGLSMEVSENAVWTPLQYRFLAAPK